jgi:hypothetical protein
MEHLLDFVLGRRGGSDSREIFFHSLQDQRLHLSMAEHLWYRISWITEQHATRCRFEVPGVQQFAEIREQLYVSIVMQIAASQSSEEVTSQDSCVLIYSRWSTSAPAPPSTTSIGAQYRTPTLMNILTTQLRAPR